MDRPEKRPKYDEPAGNSNGGPPGVVVLGGGVSSTYMPQFGSVNGSSLASGSGILGNFAPLAATSHSGATHAIGGASSASRTFAVGSASHAIGGTQYMPSIEVGSAAGQRPVSLPTLSLASQLGTLSSPGLLNTSASGINTLGSNILQHQMLQPTNYYNKIANVSATLAYTGRIINDLNALGQYLETNMPDLYRGSHLPSMMQMMSAFESSVRNQMPAPPIVPPLAAHPSAASYPTSPYFPANMVPPPVKESKPPQPAATKPNYKIIHMDEQALATSKLEDFEFMEILGTGTFGKVRLCKHKVTKKHFCMKILNKARIHRLKQTEHIHNERNVLKQINFPFIVRLFNSFKDAKSLYLLLEFIPGGELFNLIRRLGKLSSDVSRLYAAEIVLALEHLHSKKILYRDLKPENILIDETGHVKLTDFGFSKHVPTDRTMSMCGTPEYIAPEIILNNGHGKAVDWWSLGILIFEMLAGYPPFSDEPNRTIFEKIPTDRVEFPEFFDPEARDLIEKLLVVEPSRRLGCRTAGLNGAEDIKRHPWFKTVDWANVMTKTIQGPVNPGITKDGDTHNFYKYSDVNLNEDMTEDKSNLDEIFADF